MPIARYWRLTNIESYAYGDLSLSEVALYEDSVRVDSSASVTASRPPDTGNISDLSDEDFDTIVMWNEVSLGLNVSIMWDFGSPQEIDQIGIAGPEHDTFLHRARLECSDDNLTWTLVEEINTRWPGPTNIYHPIANADPLSRNVTLALNMNGPEDSTVFTDESLDPRTMIVHGNAKISTSQSKFGGSSGFFDGSAGTFLRNADPNVRYFDEKDFSIDCWVYPTLDATRQRIILSTRVDTPTANGWEVGLFATNRLFFHGYRENAVVIRLEGPAIVSTNTWTHIEITRSGENVYAFVNGVIDATTTVTGSVGRGQDLRVGNTFVTTSREWQGYMDDVRITTGKARHTSNFPVPTEEIRISDFDITPLRQISAPGYVRFIESPVSQFGIYTPNPRPEPLDMVDGGSHKIEGYVYEKNFPVHRRISREVILFERSSLRPIRQIWSDPVTGFYSFGHLKDQEYFISGFDYTKRHNMESVDDIFPVPTLPEYVFPEPEDNSDPLFHLVELLVPMNGSNGSTTFPDQSPRTKSIQAVANASISTTDSKWGGSSGRFDGLDSYLVMGNISDWRFLHDDSTPYTVEGWVKWGSLSSAPCFISTATGTLQVGFGCWVTSGGAISVQIFRGVISSFVVAHTTAGGVITEGGGFKFLQITYDPSATTNLHIRVDGILVGSASKTGNPVSLSPPSFNLHFGIYAGSTTGDFTGYSNDLRITKAIRPPEVPTTQFPHNGGGDVVADPYWDNVALLMPMKGPNGSTFFEDKSNNNLPITRVGDTKLVTDENTFGGSSAFFDGSGDYLTIPPSAVFDFGSGDFTIELFVRYISGSAGGFAQIRNSQSTHSSWGLSYNGGPVRFVSTSQPSSYDVDISGPITTGVRTHIAAVRNGNSFKLYRNGEEIATTNANITLKTLNEAFSIGATGAVSPTLYVQMYVDQLRITRGIARYTTNFIPPSEEFWFPVSAPDPYWAYVQLLLRGTGANNGIVVSDISPIPKSIVRAGTPVTSTDQSRFGDSSVRHVNSADRFSVPGSASLNFQAAGQFTFEMWMYQTGRGGSLGSLIFGKVIDTGYGPFLLATTPAGKLTGGSYNTSMVYHRFDGNATLALNTWNFIRITFDGTTLRSYINGVFDSSVDVVGPLYNNNSDPIVIGNYSTGDTRFIYQGYWNELRLTLGVARTDNNIIPDKPFPNY